MPLTAGFSRDTRFSQSLHLLMDGSDYDMISTFSSSSEPTACTYVAFSGASLTLASNNLDPRNIHSRVGETTSTLYFRFSTACTTTHATVFAHLRTPAERLGLTMMYQGVRWDRRGDLLGEEDHHGLARSVGCIFISARFGTGSRRGAGVFC
ncbi:hypothetical protein BDV98DRAFT_563818 [Pterulicium gracile]|uniref:Uncharacterized protein n=1 Tax=Pterulicium gracile TaxID=1884261 RepID=A0A5C3QQJ3_9AGAR|nr:hypothetical protein BDV98DRAFT_563818 [Pterula gracilis]